MGEIGEEKSLERGEEEGEKKKGGINALLNGRVPHHAARELADGPRRGLGARQGGRGGAGGQGKAHERASDHGEEYVGKST